MLFTKNVDSVERMSDGLFIENARPSMTDFDVSN